MSFKISRITVGKGKTKGDEKKGEWDKQYYEIEALIEDERSVELAKGTIESMLGLWLSGQTTAPKASTLQTLEPSEGNNKTELPYDPEKITWQDRTGPKGLFQLSEDYENPDHQALLKFLSEYAGGCVSSKTHFYWTFDDKKTIGRKLKAGKQGTEPSKPVEESCQKTSLLFPEDLRNLLSFEQKDDAVIIKPRQFLGSENFARIAEIVRQQGGQYVSAGKDSCFKISLKKE